MRQPGGQNQPGPVLSQLGRAAPAYRSLPAATRCSVQLCTTSCTPDPTEVWQCLDTRPPRTSVSDPTARAAHELGCRAYCGQLFNLPHSSDVAR